MIDLIKVIKALTEDPRLIKIISLTPTIGGGLIVIFEQPDHRMLTKTKVACFKHDKLVWTQLV